MGGLAHAFPATRNLVPKAKRGGIGAKGNRTKPPPRTIVTDWNWPTYIQYEANVMFELASAKRETIMCRACHGVQSIQVGSAG